MDTKIVKPRARINKQKAVRMQKKKKKDLKELINYYFSSRVTEYSRFFTGVTGAILTALSIYTLEKQLPNRTKRTWDKGNELTIIVILSIAMALVAGITVTGLLQSTEMPNSPDITILIHSGEWGPIQTGGVSQKTFHIENTCYGPVTLSFITENWSPIEARNSFEISWNYDGSPILPGRGVDVISKLVNKNNNSMICISFDIIITGTML